MTDPVGSPTVNCQPDCNAQTNAEPASASRPSSLRSRLIVLLAAIGLGVLTATCAGYSLLGFINEPNIPELFPVLLCGGVSVLCLLASVSMARDLLRGNRRSTTPADRRTG